MELGFKNVNAVGLLQKPNFLLVYIQKLARIKSPFWPHRPNLLYTEEGGRVLKHKRARLIVE